MSFLKDIRKKMGAKRAHGFVQLMVTNQDRMVEFRKSEKLILISTFVLLKPDIND